MTGQCEHPDQDTSYREPGDYDESKIAHCSACGHEWLISQKEWRAQSDVGLADFVARTSTMTAKDLRRIANIAAKAAETVEPMSDVCMHIPDYPRPRRRCCRAELGNPCRMARFRARRHLQSRRL